MFEEAANGAAGAGKVEAPAALATDSTDLEAALFLPEVLESVFAVVAAFWASFTLAAYSSADFFILKDFISDS